MRPNFLIFITDQWHPDCLGYAGHPLVRTPNLDALAKSGVNFSRAYTPQPLCMPARASLFTGLLPRGHRVRMNGIPLDPCVPTFTQALLDDGYHTHCAGKIHLQCGALPHGKTADQLDQTNNAEFATAWRESRFTSLPSPYYGLKTTDYVNGHGPTSYGQYNNWLKREHPESAVLFDNFVNSDPKTPAYDLFNRSLAKWALPAEHHPTPWVANRTIDFLNAYESQDPFMLMCSISDPHSPFAAPKPYCDRYDPADVPAPVRREGELDDLPPHFRAMVETNITTSGNQKQAMNLTEPYHAQCAAQYLGLIEMIDDQIGRVMSTLKKRGLDQNTVVIFLADHGEALGDHGLWGKGPYHFDSVIRIPLLVSFPGKFAQGYEHKGPVSLIDLAPTILEMANVQPPEFQKIEASNAPPALPGRSLLPILQGKDTDCDSKVIVEMDEDYLGFKIRTLVTEQHRLTVYSSQVYGELFDLHNDPHELHNLWDRPEAKSLRDSLRLELLNKLIETDISLPRQSCRA